MSTAFYTGFCGIVVIGTVCYYLRCLAGIAVVSGVSVALLLLLLPRLSVVFGVAVAAAVLNHTFFAVSICV